MRGLADLIQPSPVHRHAVLARSERLAGTLASPPYPAEADDGPGSPRWDGQSLSSGHAGIAILHGIRARAGHGRWSRAADWLAAAVREPVAGAGGAGLWHGAPAIAFALHTAVPRQADRHLTQLDSFIAAMAERQVHSAYKRMAERRRPLPGEFDLVRGLTGLGVYFLRRDPAHPCLRSILGYMVQLTAPVPADDAAGISVPGWWTRHLPAGRPTVPFTDGHSDQGMAHGISGPLALLSLAAGIGVDVPGQMDAIVTIRDWLERCQQHSLAGPWWPERLTLADLHTGQPHQNGPARPSWCYGTPGITRTLQLTARALDDADRQSAAETALLACITDRDQLARLDNLALCHGWSGLITTVWAAAADATTAALSQQLTRLIVELLSTQLALPERPGLIDGTAGLALVLHSIATGTLAPWTSCLLLTGTDPA